MYGTMTARRTLTRSMAGTNSEAMGVRRLIDPAPAIVRAPQRAGSTIGHRVLLGQIRLLGGQPEPFVSAR